MANITLPAVALFIGALFIVAVWVCDLIAKDTLRAMLNRLRARRLGRWVGLDRRKKNR